MNTARRIQSLRPHRQRIPATYVDNLQNQSCICSEQWCIDELATYLLITMIIIIALFGVWAKKDFYV